MRETVTYSEQTYWFDMICPITGDLIYKRTEKEGQVRHIILTNPDAWDNQRLRLAKLSS